MSRSALLSLVLLLGALVGCDTTAKRGSFACGFASLTAPLAVQQAFTRGQALTQAPWNPADSIRIRIVAGALFQATVQEVEGRWQVTLADTLPSAPIHGHAVLVTDQRGNNLGILLFEGPPLPGAALIGTIQTSRGPLPLIGVEVDRASLDQADCPLFGTPS